MKRSLAVALILAAALPLAASASADRARVVHRGHRTHVTVHRHFPLHRALPRVVVRAPRVTVRVAPRAYLAPVAFGAVLVRARPEPKRVVWHDAATLDRADDWVDFTLAADRRGDRLFLDVDRGAARISFAEVVFENGDAQVVDFDDKVYAAGYYALLEFKDGRKVDHVRIVAKARAPATTIGVDLVG
jgi:hypothetical protein